MGGDGNKFSHQNKHNIFNLNTFKISI